MRSSGMLLGYCQLFTLKILNSKYSPCATTASLVIFGEKQGCIKLLNREPLYVLYYHFGAKKGVLIWLRLQGYLQREESHTVLLSVYVWATLKSAIKQKFMRIRVFLRTFKSSAFAQKLLAYASTIYFCISGVYIYDCKIDCLANAKKDRKTEHHLEQWAFGPKWNSLYAKMCVEEDDKLPRFQTCT